VSLTALVLYLSPALGISTVYQETAQHRENVRLQLNEMITAVVAFDITVLIGSFMRWRYVWLAAAVPFAIAVLVLVFGALGTA
jgi:hypothetical protein